MAQNEQNVEILKEWITKQPHLPQKNENNLIRRFLHCTNDSIELSKKLIDLFYTLRSHVPEVYSNRNIKDPQIQDVLQNIQFLPLPKRTKENNQLFIYRLMTNDPEKYDFINGSKVFGIFSDVRMVEDGQIPDGEIPIFDMNNFSAKHITKIVFPIMRKVLIYLQEAHPVKLKQVHCVNAPPFFDKLLALVKPIMKSEVLKMLHFHPPNSETLFNFIPKDLLPEEYGGTIGTCKDISEKWCKILTKWEKYISNDEYWKVDESKRSQTTGDNASQHFGMQGSFKSLNID